MNVFGLSDNIEIIFNAEKNKFGVYARKNIIKGTILYIERGFTGSFNDLEKLCSNTFPHETDNLYPRNGTIFNKIKHNCWGDTSDKNISLYFFSSKINHSCIPNIDLLTLSKIKSRTLQFNITTCALCAITVTDISKGSELFVQYSEDAGHGNKTFNWECDCNTSYEKREKQFLKNIEYVSDIYKYKHILVAKIMLEYYNSESYIFTLDTKNVVEQLNNNCLLTKDDVEELLLMYNDSVIVLNSLKHWAIRNEYVYLKNITSLLNINDLKRKRKLSNSENCWYDVLLNSDHNKLLDLFSQNELCPDNIIEEIIIFVEKLCYEHGVDLTFRNECFDWAIRTRNKNALKIMQREEMISDFLSDEDRLSLNLITGFHLN